MYLIINYKNISLKATTTVINTCIKSYLTTPKSKKQNNHLSFWFSSLKIKKRPLHMTLEIQLLAWDRQNHAAWLNRLIESTLPS
jgi:hypothetical protein